MDPERSEAAAAHAAALERTRRGQVAQAGELLRDFVARAQAAGIEQVALKALGYGGRHRYRTGLTGWYLRRNCTVGVDASARYYILKIPDSLGARVSGARIEPSDPPLVVGAGGRDGEAIDLRDLLANRLAAGTDWPRP